MPVFVIYKIAILVSLKHENLPEFMRPFASTQKGAFPNYMYESNQNFSIVRNYLYQLLATVARLNS